MNGKRIVQVVKTFDGALWAVEQVHELVKLGWEVHVIAPSLQGRYLDAWKNSGAILHAIPCEFPVKSPWKIPMLASNLKKLIYEINPDLIHSHFVSTTLMLRYAMKDSPIPRIFQVPGPLHLEHSLFGQWETMWSNQRDYWVASSQFIQSLYTQRYDINPEKIFLSYYGTNLPAPALEEKLLRKKYQLPEDAILIGNVSFIYPPKNYLGQTVGLKGHELMIDALADLMEENEKIWAVFIGQQWGNSQAYFENIKARALSKSSRFIFTGYLPQAEVMQHWKEFDLALHIPSSENCGGVIEPLMNQVPTIASSVGGLPEVVMNGITGHLLPERSQGAVTQTVRAALEDYQHTKELAINGKHLVERMFDVKRTSLEIDLIYRNILGLTKQRPSFQAN